MMRPDEERQLTAFLRQATPVAPADLGKDIREAVRVTGQRPRWSARLHVDAEMAVPPLGWSTAVPLVAVLATLLIALLGVALVGALLQSTPVPNGRLVHAQSEDGRFDIYVREADGSNPRVIAHGDCPTFVADGRLVWTGDSSATSTTVFLAEGDGTRPRQLSHLAAAHAFQVSPDGRRVAWLRQVDEYVVEGPEGLRMPIVELWVSDLENGPGRRLSSGSPGTVSPYIDPVWSPDGGSIAFGTSDDPRPIASTVPPRTSVRIIQADGDNERIISERRGQVSGRIAWSPDGRNLAYGGELDDSRPHPDGAAGADLFVADLRSGLETNVTGQGTVADRPAWSPDGRSLAYVGLTHRLHVVPMDDGRPVGPPRTHEGLVPVHVVGWSPDAQWILAVLGGPSWEEGSLALVQPTLQGPDRTLADGVVTCLPSWERSHDE